MNWREHARTPRGQMHFLLGLLLVAGLASAAAGFARPFFESFVREKYPRPSEAATRLSDAVAVGSASVAQLREAKPEDFDGVYTAFMRQDPKVAGPVDGQRGDELPPAPTGPLLDPVRLGRLLFEARPDRASALLRRTLVAGSPAQRERALLLCARVERCPELLQVLEHAADRAHRTRDEQALILAAARDGLRARSKP